MQQLNVQPSNPTPYTAVTGTYNTNPVPGAGGLPALSGLNNRMNPLANELRSYGRGDDSMLIHMTPDEVNSLQGLAMAHGTTMTINPHTGLPEAGLLGSIFKKLIPTLLGGALAATGVGAPLAAGIVGLGSTALTGSLKKGLMAGLGAFGGASLAGAAGLGSKIGGGNAFGLLSDKAGVLGSHMGQGAIGGVGNMLAGPEFAKLAAQEGGKGLAKPGLIKGFTSTASRGLPGIAAKAAPMLATSGLMNTVGGVDQAIQQNRGLQGVPVNQNTWKYEGPYQPVRRVLKPRLTGPGGMGEIDYFEEPDFGGYLTASGELRGVPGAATPTGFADGGETKLNMGTSGGGARQLTAEEGFALFKDAVPVEKREYMAQFAGDANAFKTMSEGIIDPKTGRRSQFAGSATAISMQPGAIQQFGDTYMRLGDDRRWYTLEAPKTTGTNTTTTTGGTGSNTSSNTTTNVTSTRLGYDQNTPTSKTDGLPPGATPSGYGVYTLKDTYTPSFTKVEDFVTDKVNPYTGGTEQTNKLEEYIKSYRTSPGPVTASVGYAPGQSPSQRNRAYALELARLEEERAKAAAAATNTYTGTNTTTNTTGANATTGAGSYFYNPATNNFYNNLSFTGEAFEFDPVTGQFRPKTSSGANSGSGGRDTTGATAYNAKGGSIHMDDGAFVVDARTVSELGNGSSSAGQELLARLGGRPVRGPGDGVSDSIPARIGGVQKARVARDEVIFPAAAVKKLGGAKKLYALMDKAHKARKKADRGEDTKLRKGLGAL